MPDSTRTSQPSPLKSHGSRASPPGSSRETGLTRRQLEVLRLLAGGVSNREIAARLDLAEATIKTHVGNIMRAFGARNRTQLAIRAHELNLAGPEDGSRGAARTDLSPEEAARSDIVQIAASSELAFEGLGEGYETPFQSHESDVVVYRTLIGATLVVDYISESVSQFGYSPAQFYAGEMSLAGMMYPSDIPRFNADLATFQTSGRPSTLFRYRIVTSDGRARWIEDCVSAIRDQEGRVIGFEGVFADCTERARILDALRLSEHRCRILTSGVPVGIFRTDGEGRLLYANESWDRMTGRTIAEEEGEMWYLLVHNADRPRIAEEWDACVVSPRRFRSQFRIVRPDGGFTWVIGDIAPHFSAANLVDSFVGSFTEL